MSTSNQTKHKNKRQAIRHARVRAKISGTSLVPRLCVSRSNRHIFAQLIDDIKGKTLAVCSDVASSKGKTSKIKKSDSAFAVGEAIAKKAQELKAKKVVFDRSGYKYHGRIKNLAEGARKAGLEF